MPQKIPLPADESLPVDVAARLNSLPPINVYRMIANAPQCVIPWTDMVKALYASKAPVRLREIAILRQATLAKSDYELHQHKFIASNNGLTKEEIDMICADAKVSGLSEQENLICQMAEELETQAGLSDATLSSLQQHFDTTELTELILITSFYCCVARVLNATRVEIEDDNPLADVASPN